MNLAPVHAPAHRSSTTSWSRSGGFHVVGLARGRVSTLARRWGISASEALEDLETVTSELVTNALRHTCTDLVTLTVHQRPDGAVGVEVVDQGPSKDIPRPRRPLATLTPEDAAENGRGLALVEALCREWGAHPCETGQGYRVWAYPTTAGHVPH